MSQPIPAPQFPALNSNGSFRNPWFLFFAQFAQQPGPIAPITPTASPFTYTASGAGNLVITGGTVSDVTITRSGTTVDFGTASSIPMVNNDVATVTYSIAPTMSFIPG